MTGKRKLQQKRKKWRQNQKNPENPPSSIQDHTEQVYESSDKETANRQFEKIFGDLAINCEEEFVSKG